MSSAPDSAAAGKDPKAVSAAEWRAALTAEQYHVTREKGTERPWSSVLEHEHGSGVYTCVCCGEKLFVSDHKFDSGCGWPSFFLPADKAAVAEHADHTLGRVRTEVTCAKCGAHLGHVFKNEGLVNSKTGDRYCINGVALKFKKGGAA